MAFNPTDSLDVITNGGTQVTNALTQQGAQKTQQAGQTAQQFNQVAQQLQTGIAGIGEAYQSSEELELRKQQSRLQTRAADDAHERQQTMLPLEQEAKQTQIVGAKTDNQIKAGQAQNQQWTNARNQDQAAYEDQGVINSYTGRKPDGFDDMTQQEQAAAIRGVIAGKGAQLGLTKTQAEIDSTRAGTGQKIAETEKTRLEAEGQDVLNATNILKLSTMSSGANLGLARDPTQAYKIDVMMDPSLQPTAEAHEKAFTELFPKTQATNKQLNDVQKLADVGGGKLDVNGQLTNADEWIAKVGGLNGLLSTLDGDPSSGEAKGLLAKNLYTYAHENKIPIGKEFDYLGVQKASGGDPFADDHDGSQWSAFKNMALQQLNGPAQIKGVFDTASHNIQQSRQEVTNSLTAQDAFRHGVSLDQRSNMLYNVMPSMYKPEGSKNGNSGYTLQEFAKLPPQQQVNLSLGPNAYQVPQHWSNTAALQTAYSDPKFLSTLGTQAGIPVTFQYAQNQRAFDTDQSARLAGVSQAAAQANSVVGVNDARGAQPPGGIGPAPSPAAVNPNTPLAWLDQSGQYSMVGDQHLVPLAGVTPEGPAGAKFQADFTKAFKLSSSEITTFGGSMKPKNGNPAAEQATATPASAPGASSRDNDAINGWVTLGQGVANVTGAVGSAALGTAKAVGQAASSYTPAKNMRRITGAPEPMQ